MPQSVDIINLGCSKNLVDSEKLYTQLVNQGVNARIDPERVKADVLIINTCGFIHDAREESINTILQAIEARKSGRVKDIRVMGCLVERYMDDLVENISEIDKWYELDKLDQILGDLGVDINPESLNHRKHTTPTHYAYLKVSEGCNRNCSFCAIPAIRGKHISREMDDILEEARYLAQNGVRELILIAQDLTYYGLDIYGEQRLPELVSKLNEIPELEWIRLHYAYPARFPMNLLKVIRESEKVCKYLDIPLQHIADPVLKSMKRGLGETETKDLVQRIREEVPGIALRTTFLVGHPGETEKDFSDLMEFINIMRFERLGVFAYSEETGTEAGDHMTDDVPKKIKENRTDAIMLRQSEISLEINKQLIGSSMRVIIDREEDDLMIGRTEFDSPEVDQEVIIQNHQDKIAIGHLYDILITDADEFDLYGIPNP